jgi:hypothetical protein
LTPFSSDGFFAQLCAVVLRIALLLGCAVEPAYAEDSLEYKIKAAYLYNFTKFITWPLIQDRTFNICLLGNDPFQDLLLKLEEKTAQDKPIHVIYYDSAEKISNCQIIYFGDSNQTTSSSLANTLAFKNLDGSLTVGSQPLFAESGGMIGFALEHDKIRLHINAKTLKRSGLVISAKLLEVASIVGEDEHE